MVNVASHSGMARPATMNASDAVAAAVRRTASQPMPMNDAYIRPMASSAIWACLAIITPDSA